MSNPTVEEIIVSCRATVKDYRYEEQEALDELSAAEWDRLATNIQTTADHLVRLSRENKIMREAMEWVDINRLAHPANVLSVIKSALEKAQDK